MQLAVVCYNIEPTMKHVDIYANGKPELRRELIKFANYVARYGDPKWFV